MSFMTTADKARIFYKDWGQGQPVVLSHGWPLPSDAWDGQMLFMLQHGYRVIAHDRRGHGRSDQPTTGNDMDTYADDLAAVMDGLDLNGAIMIIHSTGGGEVARYIGRHGTSRVAKDRAGRCGAADHGFDRRVAGRARHLGVRQHPQGRVRQPIAVL